MTLRLSGSRRWPEAEMGKCEVIFERALRAFELADEVAVLVYRVTARFPREELYSLTSQMRRTTVSVPSNIVECCARDSHADD